MRLRNQNILRNSLALQRLGVSAASSLLKSTIAKSNKKKPSAREDSGSFFEPEDSEDIDQVSSESTMNDGSHIGVTRLSKRVMAPNEKEEQPTRRTRQRTRELSISENDTTSTPEDAMVARPNIGVNMGKRIGQDDNEESHLENYMEKVAGAFAIDTNKKTITETCSDLFKGGQQHMRYRLKKEFFDNVSTNQVPTISPVPSTTTDQWRALVVMWSDPKHKEKCVKNKCNKEKAQCMQKTGSRSFIAHCHAIKQEKYKDVQPTEIDLFKECHCSSKTGFTESVKKVIADMEAIMAASTIEGGVLKTPAQVVAEVLPKTTFLRNAELKTKGRSIKSVAAAAARVEELEKSTRLKEMEQVEEARLKQVEEMENLKKGLADTQAVLQRLLALNQG
ncbi:hypothetical protein QOZ80_1BG0066120 [Eleusine coracana subsp. coracana]|nr:hypothetical protein QOZ80_1BG0066120 [Eleusine coracana subsp. coracana]